MRSCSALHASAHAQPASTVSPGQNPNGLPQGNLADDKKPRLAPSEGPGLSPALQRFLMDEDDRGHAYINGLVSESGRQAAFAAELHKVEHLCQNIDGLHIFAKDDFPGFTFRKPSHNRPSSPALSNVSVKRAKASLASSESTPSSSTNATSIGEEVPEHDTALSPAAKKGQPSEDDNLDSGNISERSPLIPGKPDKHMGPWQCTFKYEEATFESWVDHFIEVHLKHAPVERMPCPSCKTVLFQGYEHNSDNAKVRQGLQHLRAHAPWRDGNCEWLQFHPEAYSRTDLSEATSPNWGRDSSDSAVSKDQAAAQKRDLLAYCFQLFYRNLTLPLFGGTNNCGVNSRAGGANDGTKGSATANDSSASGAGGKRSWSRSHSNGQEGFGDDGSNNADEGGDQKRQNTDKNARNTLVKKLACPFFKDDPERHSRCAHNSFKAYPQMRIHIKQEHRDYWEAMWCGQCKRSFLTGDGEYREHFANDRASACQTLEDGSRPEPTTLDDLLRHGNRGGKDEEKWRKTSKILFGQESLKTPYSEAVDHVLGMLKARPPETVAALDPHETRMNNDPEVPAPSFPETPVIAALRECAHGNMLLSQEPPPALLEFMRRCALRPESLIDRWLAANMMKTSAQLFLLMSDPQEAQTVPDQFSSPGIDKFETAWRHLNRETQYISSISHGLGGPAKAVSEHDSDRDSGIGPSLSTAKNLEQESSFPQDSSLPTPAQISLPRNGSIDPSFITLPSWMHGTRTRADES